jgi:RimJ/RimL family protein N-acetyltransferase
MPTTERLLLEPLDHEHAEGMVSALNHESVGTYIGGPAVTTVEALHTWIDQLALGPGDEMAEDHWWNWAARRGDDGLILGYIQATGYADWAEVAYVFGPSTGGNGYATEAVRWLVAHLADGGRSELWAAVHRDNAASIRLITRVGFSQVAATTRQLASYDEGDLLFQLCVRTAVRPG